MRACFVTGTDTGVGKTVVSAAIIAVLRARGATVRALKPVITGLEDPPDPVWPADHALLAALTGQAPSAVAPIGFAPAVSPHLAAEMIGAPLQPAVIVSMIRSALASGSANDALVVEGVGGLLVPFTDDYSVRELAVDIGLPLVLVARAGLGTINHTLLTLEAARAAGLRVAGIVLNPWPAAPDLIEASNRETIERLSGVPVSVVPLVERPSLEALAAAGAGLPVDDWL